LSWRRFLLEFLEKEANMNPRRSSGVGALLRFDWASGYLWAEPARLVWRGVRLGFLNQMRRSRSIIIYVEEKKNGARQCGAQTPKQQPTKCRSETGTDAPSLCHIQRAKECLKTA
jgi:hypothetical protein